MATSPAEVERAVQQWLSDVVVGLNLCPFAARPFSRQQIRFCISTALTEEDLLQELAEELERLDATPAQELETTLLIVPGLLTDFSDYNQFLDWVDQLISQGGWEGIYQVASFHPHYQFAGTEPEDTENLTNRAPYPILHLLREASIEQALEHVADADQIPVRNIQRMNQLTATEKQQLFAYLFKPVD